MVKLVPLFSNCLPSTEQDIIRRTITKQAQCLAEFEYTSNPHIDLINEPSAALNNHSLHSIVMAYQHNQKKTFLSLDWDHSSGQVIFTYPRKYRSEANGRAHHLVKYMEYENGTPALRWFNSLGLAAAADMTWNAMEGCPISKSEAELTKIATMEFDWLDSPNLNQTENIHQPTISMEDLSIVSFDAGHKPSGKVADNADSLAPASVANAVNSNTTFPQPLLQL